MKFFVSHIFPPFPGLVLVVGNLYYHFYAFRITYGTYKYLAYASSWTLCKVSLFRLYHFWLLRTFICPVWCRMPSYDPYSVLICLVLFPNEKSLFHLNSWLGWLAAACVQQQRIWLVWVKTECWGLSRKEPGSVLLQLVEKKGTTCWYVCSLAGSSRACVFPVFCVLGNRISVVPEYRSLCL